MKRNNTIQYLEDSGKNRSENSNDNFSYLCENLYDFIDKVYYSILRFIKYFYI